MSGEDPGLRPLELPDLANLSISGENELYWKGQRIEVKKRIDLTWRQVLGAAIVGAAAVFGAVASGLNDGSEFLCSHGLHWACGAETGAPAILKGRAGTP